MLDNLTTLYKSLHHLDISSERSRAAYARLVKHINTVGYDARSRMTRRAARTSGMT